MTTNKPGSVNQQPLYGCTNCYEDYTWPAGDLRVHDSECWCDPCWDERRWEIPDQPCWNDLEPYTPALQAECALLRAAAPAVQGEPVAVGEVESQDPIYFWREIGETDWMECRKDWYWKCVNSPEHDTKLLYTAPQPATLRPIEEAPQDGTAILAWCVHEADPYYVDETGRLTAYGANAEGMAHVDDGWNLVHWQEGFFDGECHVHGWWTLADGYGETAANPVLWVPLPANPKPEDIPGTGNSLERG